MQPKNNTSNDNQGENDNGRDAAANLIRNQLDAIYQGKSQQHSQQHANSEYLKQYHTQWQDYYQKYYERYYVGELSRAINEQEKAGQPPVHKEAQFKNNRDEEIANLRARILSNAKDKAKKVKKSRHFVPIMSAVAISLIVAFLQYNQLVIANVLAYVSPGSINPQNIIVDPTSNIHVGPEPKLIIPKINVDVPMIYNVQPVYSDLMAAMQKGVAHFAVPGADSVPGQKGNTVFSGHSSNDLFDPGDYKFIFAQLEKMKIGDSIYVNYNSIRYTYSIVKIKVVGPDDVQSLMGYNDKPYLTLITCTPLGTSLNRLLVIAEQVAPDPSRAGAASGTQQASNQSIPGNAPTLLERLFGAH